MSQRLRELNNQKQMYEWFNNPQFISLCGLLQKFGVLLNLGELKNFAQLKTWLLQDTQVNPEFRNFVNKIFALSELRSSPPRYHFQCAKYSKEDAETVRIHGIEALSPSQKLRFLTYILDRFFVQGKQKYRCQKFFRKINAWDLRVQPLGCDRRHCVYVMIPEEQQNNKDTPFVVYKLRKNNVIWGINKRAQLMKVVQHLKKPNGLYSKLQEPFREGSPLPVDVLANSDVDLNALQVSSLLLASEEDLIFFLLAIIESVFKN